MLKQQIQDDVKTALKEGKSEVAGVLRLTLAAIMAKAQEKRYKEKLDAQPELNDEEVMSVVVSEIKKRKDAIALYEQGGRPELAQTEKEEIEILKKYLPEQLSPEEIKKLVQEAIATTGAADIKDMGKVMAELNPKIKGKADGGEVAKVIKELLNA